MQVETIVGEPEPVGLSGQKGERGERGEQGFDGQKGEHGNDGIPGLNGQKGEPGIIITKTEGESYSFNEVQIREICSKLLQGLCSTEFKTTNSRKAHTNKHERKIINFFSHCRRVS